MQDNYRTTGAGCQRKKQNVLSPKVVKPLGFVALFSPETILLLTLTHTLYTLDPRLTVVFPQLYGSSKMPVLPRLGNMHLPVQKFPHTGGVLVLTLPLLVSPAPLHTILTVEVPSECLSCPPPPPTPTLNTTNILIFFSVVFSRQETGVWSLG